jgi:hypothetical protein
MPAPPISTLGEWHLVGAVPESRDEVSHFKVVRDAA